MTTLVQARDTLVALIEGQLKPLLGSTALYYENTVAVNLDKVSSPFVKVYIEFEDAFQSTVELEPAQRVLGAVYFLVGFKEGEGVRTALGVVDHIRNVVKHRVSAGVVIKTPSPTRKESKDGWVSLTIRVPFYFDVRP